MNDSFETFFIMCEICLTSIFLFVDIRLQCLVFLSTNGKLDGSNYNMWRQKIQFLLNERGVLEHLTATMFVPATKDKDNKDITSTEEYQASLVSYQE